MKNQNLLTVGVIIAILLGAIALWVATKAPTINPTDVQAAATSPGTGGGTTEATDIAQVCILELYGGAAQLPKAGVRKAQVDDAIAACVKARGAQLTTGGQCDPSGADNCSNSFAAPGQDPDSDPIDVILDVLDPNGANLGDIVITAGKQVLGSALQYCADCGQGCKPQNGNEVCQACECPGGPNIEAKSCAQAIAQKGVNSGLMGCELGTFISTNIQEQCLRIFPRLRECNAGGGGGSGQCDVVHPDVCFVVGIENGICECDSTRTPCAGDAVDCSAR